MKFGGKTMDEFSKTCLVRRFIILEEDGKKINYTNFSHEDWIHRWHDFGRNI